MSRSIIACLVLLSLSFWPGEAMGAGRVMIMRNIYSSADTYCRSDTPSASQDGSAGSMVVRADDADIRARSLIRFSLASVPRGSSIGNASLYVYSFNSPAVARTHDLHRMLVDWGEGSCTWDTVAVPGAYADTATAWTQVPTFSSGYRVWEGVAGDVRMWLDGTANYGWCIKDRYENLPGSGYDYTEILYKTREAVSYKPYLSLGYTAPWDSYGDAGRIAEKDSFDSAANNVVYMKGTGFAMGIYKVGYYDGGGVLAGTETVSVPDSGTVLSLWDLGADPSLQAGTWSAVVFFDPASPDTAPEAPGTLPAARSSSYRVAEDTFNVASAAIPEFGSVLSAVVAVGLCGVFYLYLRRRALARG